MKPPHEEVCTWKDCTEPAAHSMISRDESVRASPRDMLSSALHAQWANLCDNHKAEFDAAAASGDAARLVEAWARAGHSHTSRQRLEKRIADGVSAIMMLAQRRGLQ
jgi:hypothetical protein